MVEPMETLLIYHNPVCSNSRRALALLDERGAEFDVIEYLKNPPTRETLERLISILGVPASELVRKDKRFEELGLNASDFVEADKVVGLLVDHPELMQRPVVVRGNRAVIARPPEKLTALL